MLGFKYSLSRSNVTLATTADFLTIIAAAARALLVEEIQFAGMGTASLANEIALMRSSSGTTGSGAVTAVPLHSSSPTAAFTNFTAWSTIPTAGAVILRLGVNANGGVNRWVPPPGMQVIIPPGGQVSLRPIVGTGVVSGHVILSEI